MAEGPDDIQTGPQYLAANAQDVISSRSGGKQDDIPSHGINR